MKMLVWMAVVLGLLAYAVFSLKFCAPEPDFDSMIEQNPTAAGEVEQRPGYFRKAP